MSWANAYVGLPHAEHGRTEAGVDCWGLVVLVYARELQIQLPSYASGYPHTADRARIAALIDRQRVTAWRAVTALRAFDALLFRRGRHASHVGIAVCARHVLHVEAGQQVRIARLDDPHLKCRFNGAFRYTGDSR